MKRGIAVLLTVALILPALPGSSILQTRIWTAGNTMKPILELPGKFVLCGAGLTVIGQVVMLRGRTKAGINSWTLLLAMMPDR